MGFGNGAFQAARIAIDGVTIIENITTGKIQTGPSVSVGVVAINESTLAIPITNGQNIDTPKPFQQLVQLNLSQYPEIEGVAGDLSNVYFSIDKFGQDKLYSWRETPASLTETQTWWVLLPDGIPAGGKIMIYLQVSSSTALDGVYTGEAPQLSSTYGQYDNGANVFTNYYNFAGTSLPSGWTSSTAGSSSVSVNNGISISSNNRRGKVSVVSNIQINSTTVVDEYITAQSTKNGQAMCLVSSSSYSSFSYQANSVGFQNGSLLEIENNNSGAPSVVASTNVNAPVLVSVANNILYANYAQVAQIGSQILANGYLALSANTGYHASFTVQWVRTRAYPPNGVMPALELQISQVTQAYMTSMQNIWKAPQIFSAGLVDVNPICAYVANLSSNNVSVINTATNKLVATISVGTSPFSVAITPNGLYAYVTNSGSNNVSVINTSTNTVVDTISVGTSPSSIAITPNGLYAYVTNSGSNNVSVINTATNKLVATISVGTNPISIAITPNGLYAYIANFSSNNVSVINTSTNTVVDTISVGSKPLGIAITPNGLYAYVANLGSNNVSVINTATNKLVATISVGTSPSSIAVTPNGLYAYVVSGSGVSIINTSTNTVVSTFNIGYVPFAVAITPYFYTATQIAPYLSGFQQNTSTPQTTLTGSTAGSITYSMPTAEGSYKKFVAYANGYENDTTTAQTISFPVAFTNTPYVVTSPSGLISSISTTGITLASGTTTTYTGWIIIEGY